MNFKLVNVGIADFKVAQAPDILRTILGSCVGICLYDNNIGVAGLSHIMLPSRNEKHSNPKKYADTAIPLLVAEMEKVGAKKENMKAKLVGGASMFKMSEKSIMLDIGKNNIKKVKEILKKMKIEIISEDIGGDCGRTIDFYAGTGELKIKSLGKVEKII